MLKMTRLIVIKLVTIMLVTIIFNGDKQVADKDGN